MRAFALTTRTAENDSAKSNGTAQKSNNMQAAPTKTSARFFAFPIQRKASCACGGGCPACQPNRNLNISQPNDPAEIEADRVADQVMRMVVNETATSFRPTEQVSGHNDAEHIHRKCDACKQEEEQGVPETIQRKGAFASAAPTPPPADAPPLVRNAISSGGQPLDRSTRNFFELRLGYDLSPVSIHTGGAADESARAIGAKAYTIGNHIVFGTDQFAPAAYEGRRLIAHELTHVLQQADADGSRVGRRDVNPRLTRQVSSTLANGVIARRKGILIQREPCESLAPPNCDQGTCDEGKTCGGYDWPVCGCWSKAEIERWRLSRGHAGEDEEGEFEGSGYSGGGGTTGGGGSTDSY